MLNRSYNTQASLRKEIPQWPGSTLYKQNTAFVQTEFLFFFFSVKIYSADKASSIHISQPPSGGKHG